MGDSRGVHEPPSQPKVTRRQLRKKFFKCALEGNVEKLRQLLQLGCPVNLESKGWTPIIHAARRGLTEVADLLIREKADLECKDKEHGWTPLMFAVRYGKLEVVKMLIDAGARHRALSKEGHSPLMIGAYYGEANAVQELINARADLDFQCRVHKWTALMCAARYGHAAIAQKLVDAGADTRITDVDKFCPLSVATYFGKTSVVKVLLKAQADVEQVNKDGDTPIFIASRKGNFEILNLFISRGANANHKNLHGQNLRIICSDWKQLKSILRHRDSKKKKAIANGSSSSHKRRSDDSTPNSRKRTRHREVTKNGDTPGSTRAKKSHKKRFKYEEYPKPKEGSRTDAGTWTCSQCTLENKAESVKCVVCGARKRRKALQGKADTATDIIKLRQKQMEAMILSETQARISGSSRLVGRGKETSNGQQNLSTVDIMSNHASSAQKLETAKSTPRSGKKRSRKTGKVMEDIAGSSGEGAGVKNLTKTNKDDKDGPGGASTASVKTEPLQSSAAVKEKKSTSTIVNASAKVTTKMKSKSQFVGSKSKKSTVNVTAVRNGVMHSSLKCEESSFTVTPPLKANAPSAEDKTASPVNPPNTSDGINTINKTLGVKKDAVSNGPSPMKQKDKGRNNPKEIAAHVPKAGEKEVFERQDQEAPNAETKVEKDSPSISSDMKKSAKISVEDAPKAKPVLEKAGIGIPTAIPLVVEKEIPTKKKRSGDSISSKSEEGERRDTALLKNLKHAGDSVLTKKSEEKQKKQQVSSRRSPCGVGKIALEGHRENEGEKHPSNITTEIPKYVAKKEKIDPDPKAVQKNLASKSETKKSQEEKNKKTTPHLANENSRSAKITQKHRVTGNLRRSQSASETKIGEAVSKTGVQSHSQTKEASSLKKKTSRESSGKLKVKHSEKHPTSAEKSISKKNNIPKVEDSVEGDRERHVKHEKKPKKKKKKKKKKGMGGSNNGEKFSKNKGVKIKDNGDKNSGGSESAVSVGKRKLSLSAATTGVDSNKTKSSKKSGTKRNNDSTSPGAIVSKRERRPPSTSEKSLSAKKGITKKNNVSNSNVVDGERERERRPSSEKSTSVSIKRSVSGEKRVSLSGMKATIKKPNLGDKTSGPSRKQQRDEPRKRTEGGSLSSFDAKKRKIDGVKGKAAERLKGERIKTDKSKIKTDRSRADKIKGSSSSDKVKSDKNKGSMIKAGKVRGGGEKAKGSRTDTALSSENNRYAASSIEKKNIKSRKNDQRNRESSGLPVKSKKRKRDKEDTKDSSSSLLGKRKEKKRKPIEGEVSAGSMVTSKKKTMGSLDAQKRRDKRPSFIGSKVSGGIGTKSGQGTSNRKQHDKRSIAGSKSLKNSSSGANHSGAGNTGANSSNPQNRHKKGLLKAGDIKQPYVKRSNSNAGKLANGLNSANKRPKVLHNGGRHNLGVVKRKGTLNSSKTTTAAATSRKESSSPYSNDSSDLSDSSEESDDGKCLTILANEGKPRPPIRRIPKQQLSKAATVVSSKNLSTVSRPKPQANKKSVMEVEDSDSESELGSEDENEDDDEMSDDTKEWQCSMCTLKNSADLLQCLVCGFKKPRKATLTKTQKFYPKKHDDPNTNRPKIRRDKKRNKPMQLQSQQISPQHPQHLEHKRSLDPNH